MPESEPLLILASSSPWRRQLLSQLQLTFETISPAIDETPADGETPRALARRLARQKAEKVARDRPEAIVIGSDQVADADGTLLGKPGTKARARAQLRMQSGRQVAFHTGLCVCAPAFETPRLTVETVITRFRTLSDDEIARYVEREDVTGTAGSIKSEGLGITLVEAIESQDPSALVGLPLIALRTFLADAGLALP